MLLSVIQDSLLVTRRNSTSKIQSVIGHSCSNSKGDSGTQNWLLQKALHFPPMVVPDPAEKGGERHLFRKIKGVPCWVMTVFARELGKRVKRQPYTTTSPYLNPYFFSTEYNASCWKPNQMCGSALASYLNFGSSSYLAIPKGLC